MNKFIAPNVLTLKKVPPVACACPWCYLPCCSATCCGKDWNIHKAKCMPWDLPEVPGPINEEMQNLGLSKPTWIGLPKQVVMKDVRQNKLFSWRHWCISKDDKQPCAYFQLFQTGNCLETSGMHWLWTWSWVPDGTMALPSADPKAKCCLQVTACHWRPQHTTPSYFFGHSTV